MRVAWTLAAAVALVVGSGGVEAQDTVQPPPDMKPHKDPTGAISIELPRRSTEVGPSKKDPYQLQVWGLNWNVKPGKPFAHVYVKHVPAYARAGLCGWVRGRSRSGERLDDSVQFRDTDYVETRRYEGTSILRFRVIEHEGHCYEAYISSRASNYEQLAGEFDLILGTMKGSAKPAVAELPAGFKQSEEKTCIVWTDTKKKRDVQRIAKMHQKAWETMAEALPGERFYTDPPLVIACADQASYAAQWNGKSGVPEFSFTDSNRRAVVLLLAKRRDSEFEQSIHRAACLQYIRSFFGGPTPFWVEDGLRIYGAQGVIANGKFHQPFTKTIETARDSAVRRNATLEDLFSLGKPDAADRNSRDMELYAWHWFFRHGPGRESYGDLYDRHLALLRSKGDVLTARKVWDSASMEKLRAEFLAWIAKWKK